MPPEADRSAEVARPHPAGEPHHRVLVLSYETPAYPGPGGPGRLHGLLEPLANRHRIRVVSTGGAPAFGRLPGNVDVRLVDPGPEVTDPGGAWVRKNVMHYASGGPWLYELARHHLDALTRVLAEEIAAFSPTIVMIEHEELVPLVPRIPRHIPCIIDLHNVLLEVQWQNRRAGRPWENVKALLELPVLARAERRTFGRVAACLVVSEPNRRLVRRVQPRARVELVPNPIDVDHFRRDGARAVRPVIVMTASFHYPPNQDAARFLLTDVFPRVRAQIPTAELRLVGQRIPDELVSLAAASPGVVVVGAVPDVRPEVEKAWIAVAPLRTGSGSPLKVLEALAMEVPVVATPRVASALELSADDGLLVAGDARAFASAAVELLGDRARAQALGEAGARAVRARFDHRVIAGALERVWTAVSYAADV